MEIGLKSFDNRQFFQSELIKNLPNIRTNQKYFLHPNQKQIHNPNQRDHTKPRSMKTHHNQLTQLISLQEKPSRRKRKPAHTPTHFSPSTAGHCSRSIVGNWSSLAILLSANKSSQSYVVEARKLPVSIVRAHLRKLLVGDL